jgi:hypothetical protein
MGEWMDGAIVLHLLFLFFFVLVLEVSSDHNQDLGFAAWNEFFRIQGFKGGSE